MSAADIREEVQAELDLAHADFERAAEAMQSAAEHVRRAGDGLYDRVDHVDTYVLADALRRAMGPAGDALHGGGVGKAPSQFHIDTYVLADALRRALEGAGRAASASGQGGEGVPASPGHEWTCATCGFGSTMPLERDVMYAVGWTAYSTAKGACMVCPRCSGTDEAMGGLRCVACGVRGPDGVLPHTVGWARAAVGPGWLCPTHAGAQGGRRRPPPAPPVTWGQPDVRTVTGDEGAGPQPSGGAPAAPLPWAGQAPAMEPEPELEGGIACAVCGAADARIVAAEQAQIRGWRKVGRSWVCPSKVDAHHRDPPQPMAGVRHSWHQVGDLVWRCLVCQQTLTFEGDLTGGTECVKRPPWHAWVKAAEGEGFVCCFCYATHTRTDEPAPLQGCQR